MNEQEKARLRKEGCVHCLAPLRRLFEEALQEADFAMAEIWYHNYCGAAKMLVRLELISREKQRTIRENLLCRLLNAKYPEASPKTGTEESELPYIFPKFQNPAHGPVQLLAQGTHV